MLFFQDTVFLTFFTWSLQTNQAKYLSYFLWVWPLTSLHYQLVMSVIKEFTLALLSHSLKNYTLNAKNASTVCVAWTQTISSFFHILRTTCVYNTTQGFSSGWSQNLYRFIPFKKKMGKLKKEWGLLFPAPICLCCPWKRSFCALITVYGFSQDKQSTLNAARPIGPILN